MDSPSIKVKATATAQHLLDSVASMFNKFPSNNNSSSSYGDSSGDSGTANTYTSWGYDNENGPHTWSRRFPWAAGSSQSPVHIEPGRAVACSELETCPLRLRQPPLTNCRLVNTGVGFEVSGAAETGDPPEMEGGPLTSVYQFEQFHMHWGSCDSVGSEHALNGRLYAGELHMVHWRRDGNADFNAAASAADGLAVLAAFVEIGEANPEMEKILAHFGEIRTPDSSVQLPEAVNLAELLPASCDSYFTYSGSLTTPPCFESVCWIVFRQPICMSREQLQTMRTLDGNRGRCPGKIVNNFRHLIPLGTRTLRASSAVGDPTISEVINTAVNQ